VVLGNSDNGRPTWNMKMPEHALEVSPCGIQLYHSKYDLGTADVHCLHSKCYVDSQIAGVCMHSIG